MALFLNHYNVIALEFSKREVQKWVLNEQGISLCVSWQHKLEQNEVDERKHWPLYNLAL